MDFVANLKDGRESGDYEVFAYIDRETAETAIAEAEEFLNETKLYLLKMEIYKGEENR